MRDFYLPRPPDLKEIEVNALLKQVQDLIKEDCKKRGIHLELKRTEKRSLSRETEPGSSRCS